MFVQEKKKVIIKVCKDLYFLSWNFYFNQVTTTVFLSAKNTFEILNKSISVFVKIISSVLIRVFRSIFKYSKNKTTRYLLK